MQASPLKERGKRRGRSQKAAGSVGNPGEGTGDGTEGQAAAGMPVVQPRGSSPSEIGDPTVYPLCSIFVGGCFLLWDTFIF